MRILLVSDIHINDYPQKNPKDKYRLYQTSIVADNIIEAGVNNGCDTIIFAGDIVEKSVIRPYIQVQVKAFLDKIMKHFNMGFIILGNHDLDAKSELGGLNDSVLSVMFPPNLYYSDQRIFTAPDGCTIAFSDWKPKFDLSWIKGKVDVLVTHATICYSAGDKVKSQVMDDTKFNIAFCGDIHKPGQAGKFVSIGTPQRCKMGDSEQLTGIVFDTSTKKWEYVNLNPHDNLLKFAYTNQRDYDGYYDATTNTWYTYKPDTLISGNNSQNYIQESSTIKEINNYIDQTLSSPEFSEIHSEVLRYINTVDEFDVDFNFLITRVSCKNWRSIDDMTIYFDDMDKILLLGENGSGKSSLLSAIRYALYENRYIGDFAQFGSKQKDSYAEIEFLYQGKTCTIRRGGTWGLVIDGVEQKYNNKKEFEEDIHKKFPFIDYMDIYFYDADNNKLLGSLSQERKAIILSKFFKLDRVNVYNEIATKIKELGNDRDKELTNSVLSAQQNIGFIRSKLSVVLEHMPQNPTPKEVLQDQYREGEELMRRYKDYMEYREKYSYFSTNIENSGRDLQDLIVKLEQQKENAKTLPNINDCNSRIQEITNQIAEIKSIKTIEQNKNNELARLYNIVNDLTQKLDSIQNSICPTCGSIMNQEEIEKQRAEVTAQLEKFSGDINILNQELFNIKNKSSRADKDLATLNNEMAGINGVISNINYTFAEITRLSGEIDAKEKNIQYWKSQLQNLIEVPAINLQDDYTRKMNDIREGIRNWELKEEYELDLQRQENIILQYQSEIERIREYSSRLSNYIEVTSPSGKIFIEILSKLAEEFSDNIVTYKVEKPKGGRRLDLIPFFHNKNGNLVSYVACSSGQRTVLDVNFLSKIMPRIGLLIMDEFLKHLDPQNHDVCVELIKSMNVGCTIISSHMESIASFNNRTFNLSLNDSGVTVISETRKY